jgi:hypothetical protein
MTVIHPIYIAGGGFRGDKRLLLYDEGSMVLVIAYGLPVLCFERLCLVFL